jgi:hypothetical protein
VERERPWIVPAGELADIVAARAAAAGSAAAAEEDAEAALKVVLVDAAPLTVIRLLSVGAPPGFIG